MPVTLAQVQNMPSLLRSYKWDIAFPQIPPMLSKFGVTSFSRNFNIRCISSGIPKATMDMVSAAPRGIDLDEPGIVHLNGEIQFQLVDTVDLTTRKILYGLRQICMADVDKEQQDISSNAATYAGTGYQDQALTMLLKRLDNHNRPIWYYYCGKCFLKDYDDPQLDGQSSAVTPSMTIHYNYYVDGTWEEITRKLNGMTTINIMDYATDAIDGGYFDTQTG